MTTSVRTIFNIFIFCLTRYFSITWVVGNALLPEVDPDPTHEGVQKVVRDLNALYRSVPGVAANDNRPEGFEWINHTYSDESILAFLRMGGTEADTLVAVGNYTPVLRENFRIGVPHGGYWQEVINTDAREYGGYGYGNFGGIDADKIVWDGRPYSIRLTLPPLSMCIFRLQG